jgi:hypothetical protein
MKKKLIGLGLIITAFILTHILDQACVGGCHNDSFEAWIVLSNVGFLIVLPTLMTGLALLIWDSILVTPTQSNRGLQDITSSDKTK